MAVKPDGTGIDYQGKVAVVTGGANGIGMGISEELAKRGCKVVVVDILEDDLNTTVERIKSNGGEAVAYPMDVIIEEEWPKLLAFTQETYGEPYFLFNNAGIEYAKTYDQFNSVDWMYYWEANVMSVVYGCNTFFPAMAANGGGHINTTASTAALGPLAAHEGIGLPYAPTKHACLCFMEEFALEMAHRENGVSVSCTMPCVINTDIGLRIDDINSVPEKYKPLYDKIDNRTQAEKDAAHTQYEALHAPKDTEVYQQLRNIGVIEIEDGVATILDNIERGWFYIYTHPWESRATIIGEMTARLQTVGQPVSQPTATGFYLSQAGFPMLP